MRRRDLRRREIKKAKLVKAEIEKAKLEKAELEEVAKLEAILQSAHDAFHSHMEDCMARNAQAATDASAVLASLASLQKHD